MANPNFELHIRERFPDFLDLPWDYPLEEWKHQSNRIIELDKGISRHTVVFVNTHDNTYAIKNYNKKLAKKEYDILRKAESMEFPSVTPVGWGIVEFKDFNEEEHDSGILITEFLKNSIPFRSIFKDKSLERYRIKLQDAIAGLLVSLHLNGLFWGDCSLNNVLFRRDAGQLQAYLVDTETSTFYPQLSDQTREYDLSIMKENITGDLLNISVLYPLPDALDVYSVGDTIEKKYNQLWNEIGQTILIKKSENFKIQERIRKLNELGFTVDEIVLLPSKKNDEVQLRTVVTDKQYYQHLLHSVTGLTTRENQAQHIINEIREIQADLSRNQKGILSLGAAAFHWRTHYFEKYINLLKQDFPYLADPVENYCQILEHKWFLSEKAQHDVGIELAFRNYVQKKLTREITY